MLTDESVGSEAGGMGRFVDTLKVREFRALLIAELLSVAGDQLARVGVSVLVYQQTSSAGLTALTYALTYAPSLLGGLLLSGLADRFPRREVIVVVDVVRAMLAGLMAFPWMPLPITIALVFLLTLIGAPFKAAHQSLLVDVLPGDSDYRAGLALSTPVVVRDVMVPGAIGAGSGLAGLGIGVSCASVSSAGRAGCLWPG